MNNPTYDIRIDYTKGVRVIADTDAGLNFCRAYLKLNCPSMKGTTWDLGDVPEERFVEYAREVGLRVCNVRGMTQVS